MEEKKTIFNYIAQVFATYGIIVCIFLVFSYLIGDKTVGYSTLFALGKEGLSMPVLCELLLLAFMITVLQVVFMTDRWIMNMPIVRRYILLFLSVFVGMIILIIVFNWFPISDVKAWAGFVISYTISMIVSVMITKYREHDENSKMQDALNNYKKK